MAETRKLATILALDVAGYSRAAEQDDGAAAASVRALRAAVAEIVAPFGGRIFNTAGDGLMLEFPAASSGVQAVMTLLQESKAGVRPLPRIRIGLHLGEVIVAEDGDLLGHGVNVAARLQALAEPGSALVSEAVRVQVRSAADVPFEPQGRVQLDKMSETLTVFALTSGGGSPRLGKIARRRLVRVAALVVALAAAAGLAWAGWRTPREAAVAPRLAVLRFESMGDTEPYFAEGVADELISEAGRIQGLQVAARTSSFALEGGQMTSAGAAEVLGATLVLTGSVRQLSDSIRVQAQLVEAPSGRQIWSQAFERPAEQAFELQREIALRVAQAAGLRVTTRPHRAVDAEALEFYMRAQERRRSEANFFETETDARALFQAAVERDPRFAEAWAWLGVSEFGEAINVIASRGGGAISEADFAAAIHASERAVELDPDLAEPYETLGSVAGMLGRWQEAAEHDQEARERGGSSFLVAIQLGQIGPAVEAARRAVELDPLDPQNTLQLAGLCELQGDVACWRTVSERAFEQLPAEDDALYSLFRALIASGQPADARRLLDERMARGPQASPSLSLDVLQWMIGEGPLKPVSEIMASTPNEQMLGAAVEDLIVTGRSAEVAPYLSQWTDFDRALIANLYQPGAGALRATPEFWALMERQGLLAYWRDSGSWPDFCAREPVCPTE